MNFHIIATLAFLSIASHTTKGEVPANFEELVTALFQNVILPGNQNPGATVAIVTTNGSLKLTRGYGLKNIARNESVDESTLFLIGSISKSFLAVLTAKILNEKFPELGENVLDTPVIKLAPTLNFTFSDRVRSESMSFRDMFSHQSCLGTDDTALFTGAFDTLEELTYRTRYVPGICPFRTNYNYNNALYTLAGELLAKINGNSNYTELLGQFLQQLEMNGSKVISKDENYGKLEEFSTPYYLQNDTFIPGNPQLLNRVHLAIGAGGVISSAADMAKYIQFHLTLGKVGNTQLVPAAVMKWIYKPVNPFSFGGYATETSEVNGAFAYALALVTGFYQGTRRLSHGGYWPPYSSAFTLYPDLNLGIFSSTSGPGIPRHLANAVIHDAIAMLYQGNKSLHEVSEKLRALEKIEREELEKNNATAIQITDNCTKCIRMNAEDAPGIYGNPSQGEAEIFVDETDPDRRLRLKYGKWGHAYLRQTNSSGFLIEWDSDIIQDFLDAPGPPAEMFLYFLDPDNFYVYTADYPFTRNLTLSTLAAIPWAPDSCVATTKSSKT